MKILNVNNTLDTELGGGTAERTYQMTRWLTELGQDCKILSLDFGSDLEYQHVDKKNIIALKCINKRFYISAPSFYKVFDVVKKSDVIHIMSHWSLLNALVYVNARINKKPYVFCPAGALIIYGRSKLLKKIYNIIIGKRIIFNASHCIAISKEEMDVINNFGVNRSKIMHIPNGISPYASEINEEEKFRNKYDLPKKKIILFVGRLNKIKGVDILLNAFSNISFKFPEYQLVIAGPDEGMANWMRGKIKENNLGECIKLVGYVGPEYKIGAYQSAALLVVPSRQEAMSIVVLEAGILAKPVLLTNRCGFDAVQNVNGGKVVEPTVKGIEEGLLHLLANESKLMNMGLNLKSYVEKHYLWNNIAKMHLELFNQITDKNNI